jgi:hypothetical protein
MQIVYVPIKWGPGVTIESEVIKADFEWLSRYFSEVPEENHEQLQTE